MPTLDLPPRFMEIMLRLLAAHLPNEEVWAYGSRVNGRSHAGSDLDLVLRHPSDLTLPQKNLAILREAFRESDLPILVDLIDWARIPQSFRREIEREHVMVQPRDRSVPAVG